MLRDGEQIERLSVFAQFPYETSRIEDAAFSQGSK